MGLVDLLFGSKPKVFPVLRANSLVLLFVAVVLTFLQSCATQEASLEQRAKTWVELLGSRLARVRKRPERAKKIIGKSAVMLLEILGILWTSEADVHRKGKPQSALTPWGRFEL